MDKFLDIVFTNQLLDHKEDEEYEKIYAPLLARLKEILGEKLYAEIEELFTDCSIECSRFYGVESMKLAIGIMDGSYIPTM